MNYTNINDIIDGFDAILQIPTSGVQTPVPEPLILLSVPNRPGLSPTKIAARIVARKGEAGLPIGALPSGGVSPDEIMERIRLEEIIKALREEMIITVAIPRGITLQAAGASVAGPVTVFGTTITGAKGYGVIL